MLDDWPHQLEVGEARAFSEWLPAVPNLRFEFLFFGTWGHFYTRVWHRDKETKQVAIGSSSIPALKQRQHLHVIDGLASIDPERTIKDIVAILPRRSVVERFFAWINRNRRLAKDFEPTIELVRAILYAASVMLLARRIARDA